MNRPKGGKIELRREGLLEIELPPAPVIDPDNDPVALALVAEAADRGYESVTVDDVVRRAKVTREKFFRRFTDLENCALQIYEAHIAAYSRRAGGAFNRHSEWRAALRAAAYETADWMEEDPRRVRFGIAEVLKLKSEMARVRREETFVFCARMIDAGRSFAPDPEAIPKAASMIAIGSVVQLLSHRLQAGEPIRPRAIVPEMMFGVVRTYLGDEAAREELAMRPQDPPIAS